MKSETSTRFLRLVCWLLPVYLFTTSSLLAAAPLAAGDTLRIDCGASQALTIGNRLFLADSYYTGGKSFANPAITNILQTTDDDLYRSEHSATENLGTFSYTIPVRAGVYKVRLHFAELYFGATGGVPSGSGQRVFNVDMEGQPVLSNYDIVAAVGPMTADIKEYQISIADGALNLDFKAIADQPSVAAIEVLRIGDIATLPGPVSSCNWQPAAAALIERKEGQSAVIDDKLYTFGGYYGNLISTDLTQRYDPVTNQWTDLAPLPSKVTHTAIVVIDKKVWLIGGFVGDNPGPVSDIVQIYDTQTNTWSFGPSLPAKRASNAAAAVGHKIYAFGGLQPNRNSDASDHYVLDIDNLAAGWQTAAPLPEARNHLSGASVGGKVYAIGGQTGHDGIVTGKTFLHIYDPATNTWARLADLPSPRSHFEPSTIVIDGKILIAGGWDGASTYYADIFSYDPLTNSWSKFCDMPSRLLAPFAKVLGNTLVVSQGAHDNGAIPEKTNQRTTITRTPSTVLRFSSTQLAVQLPQGGSTTLKNLLWTYSGTAAYTLSAGTAPWLSLPAGTGSADPQGQDITLRLTTVGLAPGTYTAIVQATAPGYDTATTTITLTVTGTGTGTSFTLATPTVGSGTVTKSPSQATYPSGTVVSLTATPAAGYVFSGWSGDATGTTNPQAVTMSANKSITATFTPASGSGGEAVVYRVNAGGSAVSTSLGAFSADQYYSPASSTFTVTSPISNTSDATLYQSERYGQSLRYSFPVTSGQQYRVVLHFAETYWTAPGQRVFDVSLEGNQVLDNYDIVRKVGAFAASTETFTVAVADDTLTLDFSSLPSEGGVDNAKVSAIEVYRLNSASSTFALTTPVVGSGTIIRSPNQTTYASGTGVALTATPAAGYVFAGWSGDATGMANPLAVTMSANKNITATFTASNGIPAAVYRLHAGGGALSTSLGEFAADQYYSATSSSTYAVTASVPNTPNPALYQSERVAAYGQTSFGYELPLPNGTYTVVLHFAEIYWTTPGQRVFDVRLENALVLDNYDIVQQAGGAYRAVSVTRTVTVTDGVLSVLFSALPGEGGADRPKVSAIEVLAATSVGNTLARSPSQATYPSATGASLTATRMQVAVAQAQVAPNPSANGQFTLWLPANFEGAVKYSLRSVLGQEIGHGTLAAGSGQELDFSTLMVAPGLYYLQLDSPTAHAQLKLMRR